MHTTKISNYEKKEMIPLTDEENKFYEKQKVCYICKKGLNTDDDDNKKYQKVRDHCHYTEKFRGAAHSICNLTKFQSTISKVLFPNSKRNSRSTS